jgi:hypothetical protein
LLEIAKIKGAVGPIVAPGLLVLCHDQKLGLCRMGK